MAKLHNKNWEKAREHFGISDNPNMVLHHIDESLRTANFDRYIEWRIEDLVAISKGEHATIHHKGKTVSEETRKRMSQNHVGFVGRSHSETTKQKIRRKLKGVPKSQQAIKNMRENHAHLLGKDNPGSKKIECVELGLTFYGAAEAGRVLGISPSGINRCCNNVPHYKTAGGYHWRFAE